METIPMKFFLAVLAVVATVTGLVAHAAPITLLVDDPRATQPAINDYGEVAYVKDRAVISTTRGFLVDGVGADNLGLSNNGEVVFADGSATPHVTSTTRGVLVSGRSYGPTISAMSGEVAYISGVGDLNFFTTAQGQVEAFDRTAGFRVGVGDVNDLGEVVFELRQLPDPFTRIYSTVRGFLTPVGLNAIQPAINDFGEVVYSGDDGKSGQQIYSSVWGQLTFFGGMQSVLTADLPDIENQGRVVFRGVV